MDELTRLVTGVASHMQCNAILILTWLHCDIALSAMVVLYCNKGMPSPLSALQWHDRMATICCRLQVLSNMIDYGMEPQAALNAPRFSVEGVDSAYGPGCVEYSRYVNALASTVLLSTHGLCIWPWL